MIIVGITGTLGAGKGTIVEYLVNECGFKHYSVREYIGKEIKRRGKEVNRDTLVEVANDLRAKNSPSFITDELCKIALSNDENAVIESIRTPGEIASLRKAKNFILLAIDAPAEIRYKRIVLRQSETDQVSYKTFIQNEQREMNSTDPNKQNLSECIRQAEFLLNNSGTREELYAQLDMILKKLSINNSKNGK
jgi:dephospho-CoA kinase